jgi:hypothetical protein
MTATLVSVIAMARVRRAVSDGPATQSGYMVTGPAAVPAWWAAPRSRWAGWAGRSPPRASDGLLLEPTADLAEISERGQVDGEVQPPGQLRPQTSRGAGDAEDARRVVLDGVGKGTRGQGGVPIGTVAGQVQLSWPVDSELRQQPPQP